jgi:hypothetical protein
MSVLQQSLPTLYAYSTRAEKRNRRELYSENGCGDRRFAGDQPEFFIVGRGFLGEKI